MTKSKATASGNIKVGNVSNSIAAIGHEAHVTVNRDGNGMSDALAAVFVDLMQRVDALPNGREKSVAQTAVEALQTEAAKGDDADESHAEKWLKLLAGTAPDIWEVAVKTFCNPIQGLGTAFKKIAERVRSDQKAKAGHDP